MDINGGFNDPKPSVGRDGLPGDEKKQKEKLRVAHAVHTILFCGVLFYFGVLSLILPKQEQSEVERRELAKMPGFSTEALVEGTYTKDLELHYADTFPFRDWFVTVAAKIDDARGVRFGGARIYHAAPSAPEESESPVDQSSVPPPLGASGTPLGASGIPLGASGIPLGASGIPTEPEPFTVEDDGGSGEQQGAVFVYKDKALSIFGGGTENAERYAGVITAYQEAWGDEVDVYDIIVPTAIEFTLPDRYKSVTAPQMPNIRHIYESLGADVKTVDAYGAIGAHAGEYVYFSSDHHWTALGAYYVYRAYCEQAGIIPMELSEYRRKSIRNFKGTMHAQTNDAKLAVDRVDYYLPDVEYTAIRVDRDAPGVEKEHTIWAEYAGGINSYSVFLHGDFPLVRADTEVKNGRKALVVKESFGNAFAPFLLAHYEQLYIVDLRYFQKNLVDFVKTNGITDVVFINNIFAANTKYHIDKLANMRNPQPVAVQPPAVAEQSAASEGSSGDQSAVEGESAKEKGSSADDKNPDESKNE